MSEIYLSGVCDALAMLENALEASVEEAMSDRIGGAILAMRLLEGSLLPVGERCTSCHAMRGLHEWRSEPETGTGYRDKDLFCDACHEAALAARHGGRL